MERLIEEYGRYGKKFDRAIKLLERKAVKLHRFHPSEREIWTVVGVEGDQLVNETQPYCSCRHFHYKVLSDKDETCYHLLAVKMARKMNAYETIDLQDIEYPLLLKLLITDICQPVLGKEKNKEQVK